MLGALLKPRPWTFQNKVVLVTGGSRGLGLLLARQLAAQGARLTLVACNRAELEVAAAELRRGGADVLAVPGDVGERTQIEAAVTATAAHYGRLDVLINNAGIIQVGPEENMSLDDYETAMRTHFWGPLYAMRAARSHFKRQGGGRIVNITSIGGKVAVPHLVPYSASKFALVGLSDGFRAEVAGDNIQVTTVCPWLVRTGSYYHVDVKGQQQRELAWFAVSDSLPLVSMRGEDVAKRILEACRRGRPRLVLSPLGKVATAVDAVAPQLMATLMATASKLLPDATASGATRKGFASTSYVAPSQLTRLSDDAAARNNELRGVYGGTATTPET